MGMSTSELNLRLAMDYGSISAITIVLCITGVVGNLAVIYVYRQKCCRRLGNRQLLPSLAVIDLWTCIAGTIFIVARNMESATFYSDALCKLLYVCTFSSVIASSFMILLVTYQRYLQVCRPLGSHYMQYFVRFASLAVCVTGLVLASPLGIFVGSVSYYHKLYRADGNKCSVIHTEYKTAFLLYFSFITLIFIAITVALSIWNSFIAKIIIKQRREQRKFLRRKEKSRSGRTKGVHFSSVMMIEYSELESKTDFIDTLSSSNTCSTKTAGCNHITSGVSDKMHVHTVIDQPRSEVAIEQVEKVSRSEEIRGASNILHSELSTRDANLLDATCKTANMGGILNSVNKNSEKDDAHTTKDKSNSVVEKERFIATLNATGNDSTVANADQGNSNSVNANMDTTDNLDSYTVITNVDSTITQNANNANAASVDIKGKQNVSADVEYYTTDVDTTINATCNNTYSVNSTLNSTGNVSVDTTLILKDNDTVNIDTTFTPSNSNTKAVNCYVDEITHTTKGQTKLEPPSLDTALDKTCHEDVILEVNSVVLDNDEVTLECNSAKNGHLSLNFADENWTTDNEIEEQLLKSPVTDEVTNDINNDTDSIPNDDKNIKDEELISDPEFTGQVLPENHVSLDVSESLKSDNMYRHLRSSAESTRSADVVGCSCLHKIKRRPKITTRDICEDDGDAEGMKYSIMLMIVSIIYVLTWMPVIGIKIAENIRKDLFEGVSPATSVAFRLCYNMLIVNNIANPYVYAMFDTDFRARFLQILFCVRIRRSIRNLCSRF